MISVYFRVILNCKDFTQFFHAVAQILDRCTACKCSSQNSPVWVPWQNIMPVNSNRRDSSSQTFFDRAPLVGPVLSPTPTLFEKSSTNQILHHSIKSLENQNWHKCNMNKMAVRSLNIYY